MQIRLVAVLHCHVGDQKFACRRGTKPKKKATKQEKHFTLLGLTLLTGEPLMCVIIFSGENEKTFVETGVDPNCEKIYGLETDYDFVLKNTGKGKLFPTGPECTYKGKKIPCMCQWSPNGSMTGEILRDIVSTLDQHDDLFDRKDGKKPFLLVDGHGSRLSEPFV